MGEIMEKRLGQSREITADEFCSRCGFSKSKLYLEIKANRIPKPIKLGHRMSRWLESDIDDYLAKMRNTSIKPNLNPAIRKYRYMVHYHGWKIEDCPKKREQTSFELADRAGNLKRYERLRDSYAIPETWK